MICNKYYIILEFREMQKNWFLIKSRLGYTDLLRACKKAGLERINLFQGIEVTLRGLLN